MLDTVKTLFVNQYEAALSMLKACIDGCPDTAWNAPVANYGFSRVVFHTLYFTDLYLGRDDEASFRRQPFHLELAPLFEELPADRGFGRDFSRAELHVYNIRHINHHAAQLSLRLRLDTGTGVKWVGSGWREAAFADRLGQRVPAAALRPRD